MASIFALRRSFKPIHRYFTRSFATKTQQATSSTQKAPEYTSVSSFGKLDDKDILRYTLRNDTGLEMDVLNYGGIIHDLRVPDKKGNKLRIVPTLPTLEDYIVNDTFFNCIVGRYANRIANGRFSLDGTEYELPLNNGPNSLHGGFQGFGKRVFDSEVEYLSYENSEYASGVSLTYTSLDGEEGYPGNLTVNVKYLVSKHSNTFTIRYNATTDKKTVVNLTNHAYFNLNGKFDENAVLDHLVNINAQFILPVNDKNAIPRGDFLDVQGTPFDFRTLKRIGDGIDSSHPQITYGGGYDHNFCIEHPRLDVACAELFSKESGINMKIFTNERGIQFYSGNFLNGDLHYNPQTNEKYCYRSAVCLETQHYPNSPNEIFFPPTTLDVGQEFNSTTIYAFDHKIV